MKNQNNFKKIINSFFIGLAMGFLMVITAPLVIKQFLTNNKISEWTFSLLNRELIVYKDPLQIKNFNIDIDVWRVDSAILLLIIPIAVLNVLLTYLLLTFNKKK